MRQALELALEALKKGDYALVNAICEELKQAQPEQEPVACVGPWHDCRLTLIPRYSHQTFERDQPLYTTPPQRTWVGLTDDEIDEICLGDEAKVRTALKLIKEKNT